jgi:Mycoplasma protein of unknown function, DUF285
MFRDASSFNQDIRCVAHPCKRDPRSIAPQSSSDVLHPSIHPSKWNVTLLVDASEMFSYASAFNKSLCAWGPRLRNTTLLTSMFEATSCPLASTATWFSYSPPGPFCHYCCCRPTIRSTIEGPIEVPLVPAAAGNMHGNEILAWSSRARYRYGGAGSGTFTTLFDPTTKASTLRKVDGKKQKHSCRD